MIELHTGAYCDYHYEGKFEERDQELARLTEMAAYAHSLGLEVHAAMADLRHCGTIAKLPSLWNLISVIF